MNGLHFDEDFSSHFDEGNGLHFDEDFSSHFDEGLDGIVAFFESSGEPVEEDDAEGFLPSSGFPSFVCFSLLYLNSSIKLKSTGNPNFLLTSS